MNLFILFILTFLFLSSPFPLISSSPLLPSALLGGSATIQDSSSNAFSFPAPNLSQEHKHSFFVGNSFFKQNWVIAPSSTAERDGLGPHFNARSCSACHFKDGRGAPPQMGQDTVSLIFRISIPGEIDAHQGIRPEPTYGTQIQNFAIPGYQPKGKPVVTYEEISGQFPDGERYQLQKPIYSIQNLSNGPLHPETNISPRIAPQVIGMGLLEAIPEDAIRMLADPEDIDHDGVSGRPNFVWDISSQSSKIGRFGWKANAPSVLQQTAAAFHGDIGITSELFSDARSGMQNAEIVINNVTAFPRDTSASKYAAAPINHSASQDPHPAFEISSSLLKHVVLYTQSLAVPAQRNPDNPAVQRGRLLFEKIGCTACHHPQFTTGPHPDIPEFKNQIIFPYTDLLLHDMGEGLADNRPDFLASGNEWRTPPLWGIGLIKTVNGHTAYLHDGRARNLQEAILWHGGEGEQSKSRYMELSADDRQAILQFLNSL